MSGFFYILGRRGNMHSNSAMSLYRHNFPFTSLRKFEMGEKLLGYYSCGMVQFSLVLFRKLLGFFCFKVNFFSIK
jgi:hypothetical protein